MTDQKNIDDIRPSAAPTEDELRRWAALSKAEQIERLSAAIEEGFASTPSTRSIDEIIAVARQRVGTSNRG